MRSTLLDPNIVLPQSWSQLLTKPIIVIEDNKKYLRSQYKTGNVKYIISSGTLVSPKEKHYYQLQIGDIVERFLKEGDIILTPFGKFPVLFHNKNVIRIMNNLPNQV